jgi:hypothetical protein
VSDYSLVPVEHQPDFENVSLVPVDHDPFSEDGKSQQAQTEPGQSGQQPAAGVERLYVSPRRENTHASEPTPPTGATPQPPTPTPNVVPPQQLLQGAINQYYPGAQFTDLAQQAYQNGQYGNAIGYGVGAVADSLLALTGGKLALAGGKFLGGASYPLLRALERAGQTRPVGYATHHIVAKLADHADPARAILQKFGIGIHDAAN